MTFERGVYLGGDSHGDITWGEERSVSYENPWCRRPDVTVLMGLDGATFLSDAVFEPPTGEHLTVLGVQL